MSFGKNRSFKFFIDLNTLNMRIYIQASPNSSKNEVIKISEGEYKVKLTATPIDGKANKMLIEVLAKHFKIAKSCITIVGGKSAKIKMVDIDDL